MTLPLELREEIYYHLLAPAVPLKPAVVGANFKGLAGSCSFFHNEVFDYYFQHQTFDIWISERYRPKTMLSRIPSYVLSRLRKLRICIDLEVASNTLMNKQRSSLEVFFQRLRTAKGEKAGQLLESLDVSTFLCGVAFVRFENLQSRVSGFRSLFGEISVEVGAFTLVDRTPSSAFGEP